MLLSPSCFLCFNISVNREKRVARFPYPLKGNKMRAFYGKLYGVVTENNGNYGFVHLNRPNGSDRISKARLQTIKFPVFSLSDTKEIKSLFLKNSGVRKEVSRPLGYDRRLLPYLWLSPSPSFSKGENKMLKKQSYRYD